MLIDGQLPHYDAGAIRHVVAAVPPAEAYAAVRRTDLAEVSRRDPVVRTLFGLRSLPERLVRLAQRAPEPPPAPALTLEGLPEEGEWVLLDEAAEREICFGAIGRFWGPRIRWLRIRAGDFAAFDHPGYARIAASISTREFGTRRTLLSYEVRTAATDAHSRHGFLRYWSLGGPFVGWIMARTLRAMRDEAEAVAAR